MKRLAIIGAGGHGKVLFDVAERMGQWKAIVFFDDRLAVGQLVLGATVVGRLSDVGDAMPSDDDWIVAIGANDLRLSLISELRKTLGDPAILVHPYASVSRYARLGPATAVMAGAVINPGAVTGHGCILNTGSTVDHDCLLGDGVHICPGVHLGGDVHVGAGSWIGIGASVRHGVRIGREVTVGAGAAVVSDLPDGVTALGVPARAIFRQD